MSLARPAKTTRFGHCSIFCAPKNVFESKNPPQQLPQPRGDVTSCLRQRIVGTRCGGHTQTATESYFKFFRKEMPSDFPLKNSFSFKFRKFINKVLKKRLYSSLFCLLPVTFLFWDFNLINLGIFR